MKRFLTPFAIALSAILALTSCQENTNPDLAGPTITWASNPNFDPQVITPTGMDVKISVTAPAGISSFVVTIDSDALEGRLGTNTIDFINPSSVDIGAIVTLIVGENVTVEGAKELNLDLSSMIPFILVETKEESDHIFKLDVTDANGKTATATAEFHRNAEVTETPEDNSVALSSVDLWKNTAVLTVTGEATTVAYREQGGASWITLTAGTDGTYAIAPEWTSAKNAAGFDVYTPKEGTGIWAGKTYEFQVNGETMEYTYTASEGDVIPNGDMSGWSEKTMTFFGTPSNVPYPNASTENSFWDTGNNPMTNKLCTNDNGSAYMKPMATLGCAPGNLYTGDFDMANLNGTANFGKVYGWTSRPSALKVSYKATVGTIDEAGSYTPSLEGKPDTTRIYAVVVDWKTQHGVTSGVSAPSGMWDPSETKGLDEGAIFGYAILDITESNTAMTDVEIPFVWYDTDAKPADGNYSLVISCATSKRGDYLTGCSTNELWVDNFAWAY